MIRIEIKMTDHLKRMERNAEEDENPKKKNELKNMKLIRKLKPKRNYRPN